MGHLGAGDVGAGGGNASSCTFDPCVLIHVCFTVGLTRGRRNTLCSTWRVAVSGPRPIPSPDGGGGTCASVFPSRFRPSIWGALGPPPRHRQKYLQQHSAMCEVTVLQPLEGMMCSSPHTLGPCPADLPVQGRGSSAAQGTRPVAAMADGHCGEGPPASLWGFCRDSGPRQLAAPPRC